MHLSGELRVASDEWSFTVFNGSKYKHNNMIPFYTASIVGRQMKISVQILVLA